MPERLQFYQTEDPDQAREISRPPEYFQFRWDDNELKNWGMGFGGKVSLRRVLAVLGLARNEYEGPTDLIDLAVPGDWIVREDSTKERRLRVLEKILAEQLGRSIRFELKKVKRDVVIVRGKYAFSPGRRGIATDSADSVHIFADKLDPNEGAGGGTGELDKFLRHVGSRLNRWVINQTQASAGTEVVWRNHRSSRLRDLSEGSEKSNKINMILDNLSRQTSLQFTQERQKVGVWFITEEN
jgi:hypothetical protein